MTTSEAPAVARAREVLATEIGCKPQEINLVSAVETEWSDSSLGCPKPGMMYMQVITPGYQVVLEHNGKQYTYHTDMGHRAIRCDGGSVPDNLPRL